MTNELQKDIDRINNAGIPRDIRFREGLKYMDENELKEIRKTKDPKKTGTAPRQSSTAPLKMKFPEGKK